MSFAHYITVPAYVRLTYPTDSAIYKNNFQRRRCKRLNTGTYTNRTSGPPTTPKHNYYIWPMMNVGGWSKGFFRPVINS